MLNAVDFAIQRYEILQQILYEPRMDMSTQQMFWKAWKHARVLSGLNPLTTTAMNGSARNILVMDNKFDNIGPCLKFVSEKNFASKQ